MDARISRRAKFDSRETQLIFRRIAVDRWADAHGARPGSDTTGIRNCDHRREPEAPDLKRLLLSGIPFRRNGSKPSGFRSSCGESGSGE